MEMRLDKYLLLNWKRVVPITVVWVFSVLLHNLIDGLFYAHFSRTGGDEALFFILAVLVIPLYCVISLIYTAARVVRRYRR